MTEVLKRFIAGAECPTCQLIDKIVVYKLENHEFCECIHCGYKQQQEVDQSVKGVAKVGQREHIVQIIRPVREKNS